MNSTLKSLLHPSLLALVFFSLSFNLFAKESIDPLAAYPTQKISEHTWVIFGPKEPPTMSNLGFMNNPAFVVTNKSVVVFDPGSSFLIGKSLINRIKEITDKPITHVFNSHIHGDHWLATDAIHRAYPDVKIYSHPMLLKSAAEGEGESWLGILQRLTSGATDGTKIVLPTHTLEDQQVIKIDNINVKSHLSVLAHTKTDTMFQIVEDKILITGDNTFNQRMPRMDDGSFIGNVEVMQTALDLDIEYVVPGHGPLGGKEILSTYRDLLSIIYEEVKVLLDDDLEAFEMKPIITVKLRDYLTWTGFKDNIGKLISIAVLQAENE